MELSLLVSADESTGRIKREVVPFVRKCIEHPLAQGADVEVDYFSRWLRGFDMIDDEIVLSLAFDPKTCSNPNKYCGTECWNCIYNPLSMLLNQDYAGRFPLVITSKDTINTLLNFGSMLIKMLMYIPL